MRDRQQRALGNGVGKRRPAPRVQHGIGKLGHRDGQPRRAPGFQRRFDERLPSEMQWRLYGIERKRRAILDRAAPFMQLRKLALGVEQ